MAGLNFERSQLTHHRHGFQSKWKILGFLCRRCVRYTCPCRVRFLGDLSCFLLPLLSCNVRSTCRREAVNKWPGLITFPAFVTRFNYWADKSFHWADNFSRLTSNTAQLCTECLCFNLQRHRIQGLVQDCSNSSALAMELLQAVKPTHSLIVVDINIELVYLWVLAVLTVQGCLKSVI